MALAAIALEEERPQDSLDLYRAAAVQLRELRVQDDTALAIAGVSTSLLAGGDAVEADRAMNEAVALGSGSQYRHVRRAVAIAGGRLQAAMGRTAEAVRILQGALNEAAHAGYLLQEFDARQRLAAIEWAIGDPTGRERLEALEREAMARGLGLIARRAAQARTRPARPARANPL
jgi:hypothetical protein